MTERKTERESEAADGFRNVQHVQMKSREKAGKEGVVEKLGSDTEGLKVRERKRYENTHHTREFTRSFGLVKYKLSDKDQTGQIHGLKKRAKSTSDNRKVTIKNRTELESTALRLELYKFTKCDP